MKIDPVHPVVGISFYFHNIFGMVSSEQFVAHLVAVGRLACDAGVWVLP